MALCGATIAISAFVYGFFLLEAVGHTASRSEAENAIRRVVSELGALESSYLSHTRQVTPELAAALGFVSPVETSVVFATPRTGSLSLIPATSAQR